MKKVLIIESDMFLKQMEIVKFSQNGFEVIHAGNKAEVTEGIAQNPDIILLELNLPDISGFDILKSLRADEKTKKIPAVVFSNAMDDASVQKAMTCGATDFLVKAECTLDEAVTRLKEL